MILKESTDLPQKNPQFSGSWIFEWNLAAWADTLRQPSLNWRKIWKIWMWIQLPFSTLATYKVELEGAAKKNAWTPHDFSGGH